MGFWCESFAFAQVRVCRNNSLKGHHFKYYASSFCNAAAELVLKAFSMFFGGVWRPPNGCAVGGAGQHTFVGE